ncbi:MAG: hypothetical protein AAGB12_07470 [Pseudomonadota bacterium]
MENIIKYGLTFGLMASSLSSVSALEIDVSDYLYEEEIGLFFTRPTVSEDVVYYIPQFTQTLRDTGVSETINGVLRRIYEVTVGFPNSIDLDEVRLLKPEWQEFGFLRSDVRAENDCEISRASSSAFDYLQRIADVWRREGDVSSTELVYCKVDVAIRPDDTLTKSRLEQLVAQNNLVDEGIEEFVLNVESVNEIVNITPVFDFLTDTKSTTNLDDLTKNASLVSIGAAMSVLNDTEFTLILSEIDNDDNFAEQFLLNLFSENQGEYSLKTNPDVVEYPFNDAQVVRVDL